MNKYSIVRGKPFNKFKHVIKIMRITLFLLLLCSFFSQAATGYSQGVELSLDLKSTSIKEVCETIEKRSDYRFIFAGNAKIIINKKVDLSANSQNIEEILDKILSNTGLSYSILDNQIVIYRDEAKVSTKKVETVLSNLKVEQQKYIVRGKVIELSTGEPLPGASVVLKNAAIGTSTEIDGSYQLEIPHNSINTLVFSFLGMKTQEILIGDRSIINVQMEPDITELSEIVAVGYGSQRKANLTGAVSTVQLNDAEGRAITTASQLLQGKVAGMNIIQNSGRPGDDASTIRIRGISSIDNNNEPLVIIDGVEGSFEDIHPSDIESISVLKDASSASIYGSRASAGVIIIETKSGKAGKLILDYTGSFSSQKPTQLPKAVNSWEHAVLRNEAKMNMNLPPFYTDEQIELFKYGIDSNYPNTDWQKVFYKTAFMQNHYVSTRGGGNNYNFTSSVGYTNQDGILLGTSSRKVTYRNQINVDFLNRKLRVGFMFSGNNQDINELSSGTRSALTYVASLTPTAWVQSLPDENGEVRYSWAARDFAKMENGGGIKYKNNTLNTQYYLQLKPIKGVVGKLTYSNFLYKSDYTNFEPEFTTGDIEGNPLTTYESELEKSWRQTQNNTLQATLNYDKNIRKHKISAILGYERFESVYKFDAGSVKDLSTNEKIFNYGDPTSHFLRSNAHENAIISYFGRINYNFSDKYLLELNSRRDGSSRFAKDNRWAYFPSFSAGWRISEENFMKSLAFVEQLKLRASWGKLGNQNIGSYYAASDQMSGSEYYAFGHQIVSGRGTILLANPETRWETTEQINIGLDANLFNSFSINFDYFYKTTYDILAKVTIPPSLGVSSIPYQNVGSMLNKGIEISMEYKSKYKKQGINFSLNGNVGFLKNEVRNLGVVKFVDHSNVLRSQVGESFSSFYGYQFDGIYQIDDFRWQDDSDPNINHSDRVYVLKEGLADPSGIMFNPQPGDLKFKDLVSVEGEERAMITPEDKTIIGKSIPTVNYGLNFYVSYQNLSLSVLGQGVAGIDSYQSGRMVQPFYNAGGGSVLREHAERRWTFENQTKNYMRLIEDKERDALISSYYLFDASYFRLKNVELSLSLPSKFLGNFNIERCRFFLSGENLLLITNYLSGFDPEKTTAYTSTGFHPQVVSYTLGINLSF